MLTKEQKLQQIGEAYVFLRELEYEKYLLEQEKQEAWWQQLDDDINYQESN